MRLAFAFDAKSGFHHHLILISYAHSRLKHSLNSQRVVFSAQQHPTHDSMRVRECVVRGAMSAQGIACVHAHIGRQLHFHEGGIYSLGIVVSGPADWDVFEAVHFQQGPELALPETVCIRDTHISFCSTCEKYGIVQQRGRAQEIEVSRIPGNMYLSRPRAFAKRTRYQPIAIFSPKNDASLTLSCGGQTVCLYH